MCVPPLWRTILLNIFLIFKEQANYFYRILLYSHLNCPIYCCFNFHHLLYLWKLSLFRLTYSHFPSTHFGVNEGPHFLIKTIGKVSVMPLREGFYFWFIFLVTANWSGFNGKLQDFIYFETTPLRDPITSSFKLVCGVYSSEIICLSVWLSTDRDRKFK